MIFFSRLFKYSFSIKKYFFKVVLSTNKPISFGRIKQPCLFLGAGKIFIDKFANLGYFPSPYYYSYYYSGYIHIEARSDDSEVVIRAQTFINNNAVIIAEKAKILIGANCFIGSNFQCYSSDFHGTLPEDREKYLSSDVKIGDNCFIGNNVTILKGVEIGSGATIAAGSVVTKSFPPRALIGGNPAKLIKII